MRKNKYPWVFWITFTKREWFKRFWKSRGSNFLDLQFFKLRISIGLPWHKNVIQYANQYPSEYESMKKTNQSFNKWYHFHIGSY